MSSKSNHKYLTRYLIDIIITVICLLIIMYFNIVLAIEYV